MVKGMPSDRKGVRMSGRRGEVAVTVSRNDVRYGSFLQSQLVGLFCSTVALHLLYHALCLQQREQDEIALGIVNYFISQSLWYLYSVVSLLYYLFVKQISMSKELHHPTNIFTV